MKPIQVMFDPELLAELDATDAVRRRGRSAVLREATREYLLRLRRTAIRERYRHAYGDQGDLGEEFAGWQDEGAWPDD